MDRELTLAVLRFLDRLDTCMVEDYAYTETLSVDSIRDALLGNVPKLEAANLDIPAEAITRAGEIINHGTVHGHRYHDAIKPTIDTEEFEDT